MSFIKEKPFVVGVGVVTLLAAGGLGYFITQQSARYEAAVESYGDAQSNDSQFRNMELFPTEENREKKEEAVEVYSERLSKVEETMASYAPATLNDVTSDQFTSKLKAEAETLRSAFEAAGTELPNTFAMGFEQYLSQLPRQEATGELNYQLDAVTWLLKELARERPSAITNINRPKLSIEDDGQPLSEGVHRWPYQLTFKGTEKALRTLLSSISQSDNYLFEIDAVRISNEKTTAPKKDDVEFVKVAGGLPAAEPEVEEPAGNGGFVIPGQIVEDEPEEPIAPAAVPSAGGEMVLSQVLGQEEIIVLLDLDLVVLPVPSAPTAEAAN